MIVPGTGRPVVLLTVPSSLETLSTSNRNLDMLVIKERGKPSKGGSSMVLLKVVEWW